MFNRRHICISLKTGSVFSRSSNYLNVLIEELEKLSNFLPWIFKFAKCSTNIIEFLENQIDQDENLLLDEEKLFFQHDGASPYYTLPCTELAY